MQNINKNMTESNNKISRTLSRLGDCEVCVGNAALYVCPKCEVKTCCLACVQIHKQELSCDGIRDRTKFMPINQMTEREFMSDYCFLEECSRYAESRKRDRNMRYTYQQRMLPMPLHRMRLAASERKTTLQFMLPHFSRRKENTTRLEWKENRLYWCVEWLFTHAASESATSITRIVDERCDESKPLAFLLQKYLNLEEETARQHSKMLHNHQTTGIGQLNLWLRAEGVQRSNSRCYVLAAHKSLRENLAGKTIVEFPGIYVSYEQQPPADNEIIDSDEESDEAVDTQKSDNTHKVEGTQKADHSSKRGHHTARIPQEKYQPAVKSKKLELQNPFEWAAAANEQLAEISSDEFSENEQEFGLVTSTS